MCPFFIQEKATPNQKSNQTKKCLHLQQKSGIFQQRVPFIHPVGIYAAIIVEGMAPESPPKAPTPCATAGKAPTWHTTAHAHEPSVLI